MRRQFAFCPRCGGDHPGLDVKSFKRPQTAPVCGETRMTLWAICPATGDPILGADVEEGKE